MNVNQTMHQANLSKWTALFSNLRDHKSPTVPAPITISLDNIRITFDADASDDRIFVSA